MINNKVTASGLFTWFWTAYARKFCASDLAITTHLSLKEKVLLMRLACSCRGTTYVEIGSYLGASAGFISRGMRLGKQSGASRLYCIDTWMNQGMTEGKRDTYQEFLENTTPYRETIIPVRAFSTEAVSVVPDPVDFLFIDGDHSYEGVCSDIRAWVPKLSPGAVVAFHDVGWAEGVQRAVAELVRPLESVRGRIVDNIYWTKI